MSSSVLAYLGNSPVPQAADTFLHLNYRQQILTNAYMHPGMERDSSIAVKMSDSLKLEVKFSFCLPVTGWQQKQMADIRTPGAVSGFDE